MSTEDQHITVHVEWIDSQLLIYPTYHILDDVRKVIIVTYMQYTGAFFAYMFFGLIVPHEGESNIVHTHKIYKVHMTHIPIKQLPQLSVKDQISCYLRKS